MANTGAQLGQTYQTIMPAFTDNADIQQAFMMLWYGDPNATGPTSKGVEYYLSQLSSSVNAVAAKKTTDVIFSATAPTRNTVDYSDWIWVDTSTTNPDGASRPINIWNGSAWSQVAGAANPASNYVWTGTNTFTNTVKINKGINSFADAAARTAGLTEAVNGTLSYLTSSKRYEYYQDGSWVPIGSVEKTVEQRTAASTTMAESDADKILQFTYAGASTYTINSNQIKIGSSIYLNRKANTALTIVAGSGVTIDAQNKVLGRYASATLTKVAADTWIMQGTGTAFPPGGTANQAPLKIDSTDYNVQWISVVPATGGTFTGDVTMSNTTVSSLTVNSAEVSNSLAVGNGVLQIGGHKVFVQPTQPTGMAAGDVWIQV